MKKTITIYISLIISFASFANKKNDIHFTQQNYLTDSTIANQILLLPLQDYIGKPVDSLFLVLPPSYFFRSARPLTYGRVKGIAQVYGSPNNNSNSCTVEIYIDTFQYHPVPFYEPSTNWDMSLLKKETIAFIKVIKNDITCVYGCNNPNYF